MAGNDTLKDTIQQLEDGVKAVFKNGSNFMNYLHFLSNFHQYSFNNCILIMLQCPSASMVASFQSWKKLGGHVRKGEKGIKILVPIPYKYEKKKKIQDEDGTECCVVEEATGLSFRVGSVFDCQQVEGVELPEICRELTDNSAELQNAVERIINQNEDISYDPTLKQGGANGYYRLDTKQICLRQNMAAMQTLKTIIHEKAHSILHTAASKEKYTRAEAEVQAEAIAYVVCNRFGLNSSDYSFEYIASWANGRELKELRESLAVIEKTAKELIDWLASQTDLVMVDAD